VKLALLAVVFALTGCQGRVAHVFGGYAYNAEAVDGGCLEVSGAIDVIDGPPQPDPCNVVHCWVSPAGDVYVTDTACDAPADYTDHTHDPSGPCVKALAAYDPDGGVKCPADAGSAGAEGGS
jgi:hypothetical protein